MAKRAKKINMKSVLGAGNAKQGMLFEDAFTDMQQDVIDAADGTRSLESIALHLGLSKDKALQTVKKLHLDGYLKLSTPEEVLANCDEVIAAGRLDDGIGLYSFILSENTDNLEVMSKLAELYVRTAHAREAANLYKALADKFIEKSRLGEALVAQRKAAGLQAGDFKVQNQLAKLCVKTGRDEEAARVLRAYAMRLAGAGEYTQALEVIDTAGRSISGSDTLLYAEAEILSLMDGKGKEQDGVIGVAEHSVVEENEIATLDATKVADAGDALGESSEIVGSIEQESSIGSEVVNSAVYHEEEYDVTDNTAVGAEQEDPVEQGLVLDMSASVSQTMAEDVIASDEAVVSTELGLAKIKSAGDSIAESDVVVAAGHGKAETEPVSESTAESDRDYTSLRYREYTAPAKRTSYSKKSSGIVWGTLSVILLLIILAGINYYHRTAMYSAVMESRGIESLIQKAGLLNKIEIGENALKVLDDNRPPFEFMQSSEYNNQEARLKLLVSNADAMLLQNNLQFDTVVEAWNTRHTPALAEKILEFTESDSIGLGRMHNAEELYNSWLQEKDQKARELQDLIEVLADRNLEPQLRFSAYKNLLVNFPEALNREYPKGARGLTVPSFIKAEIAGTGKNVELSLVGYKKTKNGYWELPVNSDSNIIIEHRGYKFEGDTSNNGRTKMPYPLTYKQLFIMNKAPVFKNILNLDFEPRAGIRVGEFGKFIFLGYDNVSVFDSNSKETKSIELIKNDKALPLSVGLDLFSFDNWVGIVQNGMMYAGQISADSDIAEFKALAGGGSSNVVYAGLFDLELGGYDGVGAIVTNYFAADNSGKILPLELLEVKTGKNIWGRGEIVKSLTKNITAPLCSVYRLGWYFVLISTDGQVLLVMENGDIYKSFNIELKDNERIARDNVKLIRSNDRDYLCIDGRVFVFDQTADMALVELWSLGEKRGMRVLASENGVVVYGGGKIIVYDIANGSKLLEYHYKGEIGIDPVAVSGKTVFAVNTDLDGRSMVLAFNFLDIKSPLSWSYELASPVKLLFAGDQSLYVLTKDGTLLGLDK